MRYILVGAAAIALAAAGAYAQPGQGNGNGNEKRSAGAAGQPGTTANARSDNGNRGPGKPSKVAREKANVRNTNGESRNAGNAIRGDANAAVPDPANRQRIERRIDRIGEREVDRDDRRANVRVDRREDPQLRDAERTRYVDDRRFYLRDRSRDLIRGCPPGLAKKDNGCQPPGQARTNGEYQNRFYDRAPFGYAYRPRLFGLTNYDSGDYSYGDGYLIRRTRNGLDGYIPLLGGALAIGNRWPQSYDYYPVSDYYVDYYNLGSSDRYRYAENVIYRVDPDDESITSLAALLTGDDIAVGQPMPPGYDVYNVPNPYRDRYYDTPEANYRYSDGYIYRIDPTTQLVAAAIDLLS